MCSDALLFEANIFSIKEFNMKKVLIILICVFVVVSLPYFAIVGIPIMIFANDSGIEYIIETDEYGTEYACVVKTPNSNVKISDTYNGIPVKKIYGFGGEGPTKLYIPDSIEYIDEVAFLNLKSIVCIEVDQDNPNYKTVDGNLYTKDGKTLLKYVRKKLFTKEFVVPERVETIKKYAFRLDKGILTGVWTNSKIVIGDNVKSIEEHAFDSNYIKHIKLETNITHISDSAFAYCWKLKDICIPKSVTKIDENAFYLCDKLKRVYYDGTADEWNKISVNSKGNDALTSATVFYYSDIKPNIEGNYWYYDKKGKVQIWK